MNSSATEASSIAAKPAGVYRLLHTADWHLGKFLNDRSREEEHSLFLAWLLDFVQVNAVDAIILAGDVFDSANPPQSALAQYFDFASDLFRMTDCDLLAIAGNHDSAAQLEAPRRALAALKTHVVGFLPEDPAERIILLPGASDPRVAVAMIPFLRDRDLRVGRAGESAKTIRKQLVAGIKQRYDETAQSAKEMGFECPLIGTGHLTVAGSQESTSERGIHIGGLGAVKSKTFSKRYDYVALGHLHRPQAAADDQRVRYSGSPIALSFSESEDDKEVCVLDLSDSGVQYTSAPIPVFRRLAQLRTSAAELKRRMCEFEPESGELKTWVEVLVEDAELGDDLNERVRSIAEGCDYDVLKVLRASTSAPAPLVAAEGADDEAVVSLLEQPAAVFDHLLDQHDELDGRQRDSLRNAFALLVDMHSHSESVEDG